MTVPERSSTSWSQSWSQRIVDGATHPGIKTGVVCGLISAVFYTFANIALRHSVAVDSFFVAAIKSAPAIFFLTPYLLVIKLSGRPIAVSRHLVPRFILVSVLGQIGGNGVFQMALGEIGLAATVPITLGALLIASAFVGRWMLGESVQRRTMVAITILIGAVVLLSQSGEPATVEGGGAWRPFLGAAYAMFSGVCFAVFSSMMRLSMQQGLQSATAMWINSAVGVVCLLMVTFYRTDMSELAALPVGLWYSMMLAGFFNLVAFIAIATAMRVLPIVAVHLLNASQVAMAATAGVVLFSEPLTHSLIVGILMTMGGLLVLASRRPAKTT
ncbi:DMT family transporter [Neorhodopirellula lusitana]|uniref:DMT family transporter n=1 Tax=Neorhodopirellula lusitana TaxID=445327 RepID=UPI003850FBBE